MRNPGLPLLVRTLLALGIVLAGASARATPSTRALDFGDPVIIPGTLEAYAMACPASDQCYVLAATRTPTGKTGPRGVDLIALNNGSQGSVVWAQPDFLTGPSSLGCPTSDACYIVGQDLDAPGLPSGAILRVPAGGPADEQVLADTEDLRAIDCPDPHVCFAVGTPRLGPRSPLMSVVVPIRDGQAGDPLPVPGTGSFLSDISCPTTDVCYAAGIGTLPNGVDAGVIVPLLDGAAGAPQPIPGTTALTIDCPTADLCQATGYDRGAGLSDQGVLVPMTDGVAAAPIAISGSGLVSRAACPSSSQCYAISGATLLSIEGGTAASVDQLPAGLGLRGVTCPEVLACFAFGRSVADGAAAVLPITGLSASP